MRHLKTAFGLAAAMCLFGVMATSAFGHEFTTFKFNHVISEAEPVKSTAKAPEEEELQELNFARYHVYCRGVKGKGLITESPSTTLTTHLAYSKCGYYPGGKAEAEAGWLGLGAQVKGGLTIALRVNGAASLEGNEEGEEFEYGTKAELRETSAEIKIPGRKYCTLIIPTQVLPAAAVHNPEGTFSAVAYSKGGEAKPETPQNLNKYPGYFQHKLIVTLNLKAIKFRFNEETQCGEFEPKIEKANGILAGNLQMEVPGGNLEFN